MTTRIWAAALLGLAWGGNAVAASPESCEATLAATRNFHDGAPTDVVPLPDGSGVVYLRSGPRDTVQALYRYDLATKAERLLASPAALAGGGPEQLTVEERARRERARITASGFTGFSLSHDGLVAVVSFGGRLFAVDTGSGKATALPGEGWLTPHLSPDGRSVAAVRDNDLHVIDLATLQDRAVTTGGTDAVTHGLAEFAAEEELDRLDGFWWSPGSDRLLYETADSRGVETRYIADPGNPTRAPNAFRYPQAGTANAVVTLSLVGKNGESPVAVNWDRGQFPYLVRVVWPEHGRLSLVVLDRVQMHERVLAVDPATGATSTLLDETDPAWVGLTPFARTPEERSLPAWLPDGSGFLWASDRSGPWQLELRHADGSLDHALTTPSFRYSALFDLSKAGAVIGGAPVADRLDETLVRIPLAGGAPVTLAGARGLHAGSFGEQHAVFADHESLADGTDDVVLRDASGHADAVLPSAAEKPAALPNIAWTQAGAEKFDALVLHPHGWKPGEKLPVVLSVYAGPGFKVVRDASRLYLADQCIADRGAIVVSLDGRGTPGHGHDWERATKYDLIDKPLADQVAGLQALGAAHPEMDMKHVAVEGWSFGGYFTAMATSRRPDVFAAGVAGAPVVDFQDYDTAYTERYLGLPQDHADAYKVSNVLTYAGGLSRPLLIVHGLTDDNVYFVNTFKLTQALLLAGKPYRLLLLPGTHMLVDPKLREGEDAAVDGFLAGAIGLERKGPS